MKILKLICRTSFQLGKQVCLFPQTVARAMQQKRRQTTLNELEVERIDRICNPSKYLGK